MTTQNGENNDSITILIDGKPVRVTRGSAVIETKQRGSRTKYTDLHNLVLTMRPGDKCMIFPFQTKKAAESARSSINSLSCRSRRSTVSPKDHRNSKRRLEWPLKFVTTWIAADEDDVHGSGVLKVWMDRRE